MRLENPRLVEHLAATYVSGVLRGRARRRFERLAAADPGLRQAVREWEDRLVGLSRRVEPITPPERVWSGIRLRLGLRPSRRQPAQPLGLALAAAVLAAAVGIGWFLLRPAAVPFEPLSIVANEQGAQLWRVEARADRGSLRVTVAGVIPPQPGRSYELWALPEEGDPVSLGLLPEAGEAVRDLTPAQVAALGRSRKVAVSLEPFGGSPQPVPTGPVLYVAEFVEVAG